MSDTVPGLDADAEEFVSASSAGTAGPATIQAQFLKQAEVKNGIGSGMQGMLLTLVNAAPAPKKVTEASAPLLPEEQGVAYDPLSKNTDGSPKGYPITLVRVDAKHLMAKTTGYDFLLMRRAALRESNIRLYVNSAFRTMEDQMRIAGIRAANPKDGPAAAPGTSNHQKGLSLDIHTGISFENWKSGAVKTSPEHTWLLANAARFGFNQRDLGRMDRGLSTERAWEPWHWTHINDDVIYGLRDPALGAEGVYDELIQAGEASAYNANGSPDLFRLALKIGSDVNVAWARSGQSTQSTRGEITAFAAAYALMQSANVQQSSSGGVALSSSVPPPGFTGDPPLYDFDTGSWTDQKEQAFGYGNFGV